MRRMLLSVAGLALMFCATQSVALAGGCNPHHHHGPGRVVYRPPVYRPYVAAYQPYAVPYYAAPPVYPTAGFGLSARNFSVWFQQ